jgi:hypothetical protein
MITALFIIIIAAVVSLPMAAIVVVSIASRREDAAWSLGGPARGPVQAAARRLLDFHSEDPAWPVPKNFRPPRPAAPVVRSMARGSARGSVARQGLGTVTDTPGRAESSKITDRTAA